MVGSQSLPPLPQAAFAARSFDERKVLDHNGWRCCNGSRIYSCVSPRQESKELQSSPAAWRCETKVYTWSWMRQMAAVFETQREQLGTCLGRHRINEPYAARRSVSFGNQRPKRDWFLLCVIQYIEVEILSGRGKCLTKCFTIN